MRLQASLKAYMYDFEANYTNPLPEIKADYIRYLLCHGVRSHSFYQIPSIRLAG